jgi:hypothetical protein
MSDRVSQVVDPIGRLGVERQVECVRQPRPKPSTAVGAAHMCLCERLEQARRLVTARWSAHDGSNAT